MAEPPLYPEDCEPFQPRNDNDDHDDNVGTPVVFPSCCRIDTPNLTLERIQQLEAEANISSLGELKLVADIDSLVYISTNFERVIDACGSGRATFEFTNLIKRGRPNNSSRFKARFIGLQKPEFFNKSTTRSDFNLSWFPSIPLCECSFEGLTGYLTFGFLEITVLRTSHYMTMKQAAVVASAFTYARHHWNDFPEVMKLFSNDMEKYKSFSHTMTGFPKRFETEITRIGEVSGRQEVKKKVPSAEGRLLLRAFIASIRRFAMAPFDIIEAGHQINAEAFHGCEGEIIPMDEFQAIAQTIMKSGFICMQAVGTKCQTYNHPTKHVNGSEKDEIADFYCESANQYNDVIKYLLKSNNIEGTEPPIILQPSDDHDWVAAEDPEGLDDVNEIISTDVAPNGLIIPRCTEGVTVMYDVAISIRAEDMDSALFVVGHEAAWTLNQITSFERLIPGLASNIPENMVDAYDDEAELPHGFELPEDIDPNISQRMITYMKRVIEEDGIEGSSMAEFQGILEAMVNEEEEIGEARSFNMSEINALIDNSLSFTEFIAAIRKGCANIFSQGVTNGFVANGHSGDNLIEVQSDGQYHDTEFEKWNLVMPPNGIIDVEREEELVPQWIESSIRGGQIYTTDFIAMNSRQTRKCDQELQQFPALLMAMLRAEDGSGLYDQALIRKAAQAMWKKIKYIHSTIFFELTMQTSVRLELFLEYREDHNFLDEGLQEIGNILSSVRQVNRHNFASYLNLQSTSCTRPIEKLLSDDFTNLSYGSRTNFHEMSECSKASIVMCAEQTVMITDSFPWIGPMHKKSLQNLTTFQKSGPWSVPLEYRIKLRPSTKMLTDLDYGVSPSLLVLPNGDPRQPFRDGSSFLRSGNQTNNMFWLVNKKYKHAIQLNISFYSLICLLQQYSQEARIGESSIDLEDYTFPNQPEPDAIPFIGTFFGGIDYAFIANSLDNERRDQLLVKICLLLHRLYDSYAHYEVTFRNKKRMGRSGQNLPVKLSQFPRTKNMFNMRYKNKFEAEQLKCEHLICGSIESAITTVRK